MSRRGVKETEIIGNIKPNLCTRIRVHKCIYVQYFSGEVGSQISIQVTTGKISRMKQLRVSIQFSVVDSVFCHTMTSRLEFLEWTLSRNSGRRRWSHLSWTENFPPPPLISAPYVVPLGVLAGSEGTRRDLEAWCFSRRQARYNKN